MKRAGFVLLTLLVATQCWSATADTAYHTGESYMNLSPQERAAFVAAANDMQTRLLQEIDNPESRSFIERVQRCTKDMSTAQLRDFIDAYMAKDPAYRGYSMVSNFRAALHEKCPL